jgi:tRNA pseudouridine32 synthase/23S rRNA pseudouridine746 synthase
MNPPSLSPATPYSPPPDTGLQIVYQDEFMLVLNKPAGLLSVQGRGIEKADCMASRAAAHYPDAQIVHRLDMETSGLFLMALGRNAQRALSKLFEQRQIHKTYIAVVAGSLPEGRQEIALPLITDWPNRPRQKVDFEIGKASLTHYERMSLDASQNASRVALFPHTGRSHQLRVHMQAIGHPILGDSLYAPPEVKEKTSRLLLHASRLIFAHPQTGLACDFESRPEF